MELKNIELINFRNYKYQKIEFINGINLFVGNNAQGKTNIIESIYISAFGKSYRTVKDNEIINFESEFSKINLEYSKDELETAKAIIKAIGGDIQMMPKKHFKK
mgnify:CR=1 FL=1